MPMRWVFANEVGVLAHFYIKNCLLAECTILQEKKDLQSFSELIGTLTLR